LRDLRSDDEQAVAGIALKKVFGLGFLAFEKHSVGGESLSSNVSESGRRTCPRYSISTLCPKASALSKSKDQRSKTQTQDQDFKDQFRKKTLVKPFYR
jgi:hypothetical protein